MAEYKIAYDITRKHEGGYSNHSKDRGGETFKGIARNFWPEWGGWAIIDKHKRGTGTDFLNAISDDPALQKLVLQFYKINFWDALKLDQIDNQDIANELFDTAVNMGVGKAAIFLQESLNVTNQEGKFYPDLAIDGQVGAITIRAVNIHPRPKNLLKTLNILQGYEYISICKRNPTQEAFFHGWIERVSLY